jgi:predicted nucleic acid-binding protein
LLNHLQRVCLVDDPRERGIETDDPDDAFLLALAAACNADILVTGDRRAGLLQRGHYGRTRIVTPAIFCRDILKITLGA